MKKILALILALILSISPLVSFGKIADPLKDMQHNAEHWIIMYDAVNDRAAGCTAYAIAPHILMTAEHCYMQGADLYVDPGNISSHKDLEKYSTVPIVLPVFDHQDHALFVTPTREYSNTIRYNPSIYKLPVQGEHIYFWGNPAAIRDQYREGVVMGKNTVPKEEFGDDIPYINTDIYLVQVPVVGGDSGSAVFDENGNVVGIVSLGVDDGMVMGMWPLAFTQEQIDYAREVSISKRYISPPSLCVYGPKCPAELESPPPPVEHFPMNGKGVGPIPD